MTYLESEATILARHSGGIGSASDADPSDFATEAEYRAHVAAQVTTRERLRRERQDTEVRASLAMAERLRKERKSK